MYYLHQLLRRRYS